MRFIKYLLFFVLIALLILPFVTAASSCTYTCACTPGACSSYDPEKQFNYVCSEDFWSSDCGGGTGTIDWTEVGPDQNIPVEDLILILELQPEELNNIPGPLDSTTGIDQNIVFEALQEASLITPPIRIWGTDGVVAGDNLDEQLDCTTFETGCSLTYINGAYILEAGGVAFNLNKLGGSTIKTHNEVPTLSIPVQLLGDIAPSGSVMSCGDVPFEINTGIPEGYTKTEAYVADIGCDTREGQQTLIISGGVTINAAGFTFDNNGNSTEGTLNLFLNGVGEGDGIFLVDGNIVLQGTIDQDFSLVNNCVGFKWDSQTQTLNPSADQAGTCEIDPFGAAFNVTLPNGEVVSIIGNACVVYENGYCHNFASDQALDDPTCLCQTAADPGLANITEENCAKAIGLDESKDLTEQEMEELCSSNGGMYCAKPETYPSLCMRKVKGRPIPEDTSAWVAEIEDRIAQCESGNASVGCEENGTIPTAENCAELLGLPPGYDKTMQEMVDYCASHGGQYCPNYQYDTICLRKAKGRPVPEDPSAWRAEVVGNVDKCTAGQIVACPGNETIPPGGGGGGPGEKSVILCSELEPKDQPAAPNPQYCLATLECKPGTTCEDSKTCNCTQKQCRRLSSDDAPSPDCLQFARNAGNSEEYCDDDVDYENKISSGGRFEFVLKSDGGGTFFVAEASVMKPDSDGVKRCQPFGNFGNNPPFPTIAKMTAADDGKIITLPKSSGKFTLGTYGGAMNEGWLCPEGSASGGNNSKSCNTDSECGSGEVCACTSASCLANGTSPTCGNGKCDNGETATTCPADCGTPQVTPQCTPGKKEQCFTNPEDKSCFMQRTCTSNSTWGSCTRADDVCKSSCTDGIQLSCPRQYGVCAGSKQTCSNSAWPGCDYTKVQGYEPSEQSCDNLDNDCDGVTDEGCLCGLGSNRACGTDTGACQAGTQACVNGKYNNTCASGTLPIQEACGDGIDNDCDGSIDEMCPCGTTYGEGFNRTCGQNACGSGIQYCQNNGGVLRFTECVGAPIPTFERCGDSIDNDCDLSVDEGCGCVEDRACGTNQTGVCKAGIQKCGPNNLYGTCEGAVYPVTEKCGDKLDNDCDGSTDENCPCTTGDTRSCNGVGVCKGITVSCVNGTFPTCNYANVSKYEREEVSCTDKLDNDCDNKTDAEDLSCEDDSSIDCSDGTPNKQCSETKPNYCDGGNLIQKCNTCLCLSGERCDITGKCVEDYIPPIDEGTDDGTTGGTGTSRCNYDDICDPNESSVTCSDCELTGGTGTSTDEGTGSTKLLGIALLVAGLAILAVALIQRKKPQKPQGGQQVANPKR